MNWAYPAIMGLAITTGALLSRWMQAPLPLRPRERLGIGLGAFCGAMIGAKLPFVLADWEGFLSGAAWFSDGKTILFGLVGGYFGVEISKWALEVHIKTGDSFAVPVATAVAIGRLGCFSIGCCYGLPSSVPWAIDFGDGIGRHPTQVYESAFHLTAAGMLLWLWRQQMLRGQLIKLYILAYLAYRFASEFIRPEVRLWGGLTGYQWAAMVMAPLFVALWIRDASSSRIANIESATAASAD